MTRLASLLGQRLDGGVSEAICEVDWLAEAGEVDPPAGRRSEHHIVRAELHHCVADVLAAEQKRRGVGDSDGLVLFGVEQVSQRVADNAGARLADLHLVANLPRSRDVRQRLANRLFGVDAIRDLLCGRVVYQHIALPALDGRADVGEHRPVERAVVAGVDGGGQQIWDTLLDGRVGEHDDGSHVLGYEADSLVLLYPPFTESSMKGLRALGGLAVVLILTAIGVVVASFFVSNDLFTSSEVQTAAVASMVAVVLSVVAFIAVGRPWKSWQRTPYW